jgi:hypothetical protein
MANILDKAIAAISLKKGIAALWHAPHCPS